jgi:hypothetical protein
MQDYKQDAQENLEESNDTDNVSEHDDELDDILSDLTSDDDGLSADAEDDSGDVKESGSVQQAKKPSRWKRKQQYLTNARQEAEQLANERARENAELRARLEAQDKMWSQILGPVASEPQTQVFGHPEQSKQGNGALNSDELKKSIKQELLEEMRQSESKEREMQKLASQWQPQLERMSKILSKDEIKSKQFSGWFGKYTSDLDTNRDKKILLEVAGNLEYAAEAIYTVNKSKPFERLSLADKISALHKLHTDIVSKRKKQSESDKSIGMPKNNSATGLKNKPIGEYTASQAWDLYKSRSNKKR